MRKIELTGQRFGRWRVLGPGKRTGGVVYWRCRCDCGTTRDAPSAALRDGTSQSCGCLMRERLGNSTRTHGLSHRSEYAQWHAMRARCFNPKNQDFARYGGRGITVCERWRSQFVPFFEDIGPKPSPRHSLDRIDNDGHYEPGNVRWATPSQQASNTKNNIRYTYRGESLTLTEWSQKTGIKAPTLLLRLQRWKDIERSLTTPVDTRFHKRTSRH